MDWTIGFVAFLYYMFVVITYYLPGADIAIAVALVYLVTRIDEWRMSPFLGLFGGFVAWCFVSYLASAFKSESWLQVDAMIKMWVITFTAYNVIRTRAQMRFFLAFAIGCFILFPTRGAFVNYLGGYNVLGRALWNFAYANPNDLAAYALLYAAMACAFFFISRHRLLKLGAIAALGLLLLLILFTQSRGALIAAGVVGALVLLANRRNVRVLLGTAGLVVVALFFAPRGALERLAGLGQASMSSGFAGVDQERSAEQRYQLLQVAVKVANDNPLFGVGPGAYSIAHGIYASRARSELPLAGGNRDAHNTVMRTLAELGWFGLALFLGMILQAWVRTFRMQRNLKPRNDPVIRFLSFGLVAFMVAGLFGSFTYLNVLYLQLILLEIAFSFTTSKAGVTRLAPSLRRSQTVRGVQPRATLRGM